MFWGLPLIVLMTLFHFLDKRFGPYVRYPIALIGLFPLLLVIYFGAKGDVIYMRSHHSLQSGVVCRLAGNVAYFLQRAAQRNYGSIWRLNRRAIPDIGLAPIRENHVRYCIEFVASQSS